MKGNQTNTFWGLKTEGIRTNIFSVQLIEGNETRTFLIARQNLNLGSWSLRKCKSGISSQSVSVKQYNTRTRETTHILGYQDWENESYINVGL